LHVDRVGEAGGEERGDFVAGGGGEIDAGHGWSFGCWMLEGA
jgi:hypothetical protein